MFKTIAAAVLAMGVASTAYASSYEYHFLMNPDADSSEVASPALDVSITFGFNDNLPAFSMAVLSDSQHWRNGNIWMLASFQGQTVNLAAGLDPDRSDLEFAEGGGWIETWPMLREFLDIDLHPWSPFVAANNLPFDPFVYGQLDAYDDQQDFQDLYGLWAHGDVSSLAAHAVAVPEPTSLTLTGLGLLALAGLRRRRRQA